MQKRAVRLTLFALLLVTGLGAALLTWDTERRIAGVLSAERDVDTRIDRLMARAAALGAAQQAAVAPGQAHAEWLSRGSLLLQQLYDEMTALRPRIRSTAAAPALAEFAESLDAVVKADARAREHLQVDQELMAADVVFTEARQDIEGMISTLGQLQAAERNAVDGERTALDERRAQVLGGAAVIWLLGLLALMRVPEDAHAANPVTAPVETTHVPAPERPAPSVDMTDAAELCTALSRVTSALALPDLLARAARVLDASGIIVWLGAGEELFPTMAHGYDARVVSRLGPIPRNADNATAAAWRTAETRIVSGDVMGNGAIVTPLFGPDGSIGALAAEIRHGREADETTRAVAVMIAAQLAAVVAAWPAPSTVEGRAVDPPAPLAPDGHGEARSATA